MGRQRPRLKRHYPVATTSQTPSSNQPDPFKYSYNPAWVKPIGPVKQFPKSKQLVVEGRSSLSVQERANLPKQSISAPVTASVAGRTTTGNGVPKQIVNNQTRHSMKGVNQYIVKEIEILKAMVAENATRIAELERERAQDFTSPIKDDDQDSPSPLTEDHEPELIPRPDPLGNLLDAMRLRNKKQLYNSCRANVATAMLQVEVPFSVDWHHQDLTLISKAAARARELEPQLGKYVDDWATYEIIKSVAKNKRNYHVRRGRGLTTDTTGKIKTDGDQGDQAEASGLVGYGSVRLDSATVSSHEEDNEDDDSEEADDSGTEDDDGCQVNGWRVHQADSWDDSELSVEEGDDSEACASEAQDDEILSEINDDGSGIDEADDPGINDSEIGGTDIKGEGDEDEAGERIFKMETDNEDMVNVGQIPAMENSKVVTKKGLKRRLAKDSDLREDGRTTLTTSKPMMKRKKN